MGNEVFNWDLLQEKEYWNLMNYSSELNSMVTGYGNKAHFPASNFKSEVERKFTTMYGRELMYKLLYRFIDLSEMEEWEWLHSNQVITTGKEISTILNSMKISRK